MSLLLSFMSCSIMRDNKYENHDYYGKYIVVYDPQYEFKLIIPIDKIIEFEQIRNNKEKMKGRGGYVTSKQDMDLFCEYLKNKVGNEEVIPLKYISNENLLVSDIVDLNMVELIRHKIPLVYNMNTKKIEKKYIIKKNRIFIAGELYQDICIYLTNKTNVYCRIISI